MMILDKIFGYSRAQDKTESPVEKMFLKEAQKRRVPIVPQHTVRFGRKFYRLDFAVPQLKIAVEIDGHDYHSSKSQRQNDYERERALMLRGWTVFRFTGSDVYRDVGGCVSELVQLIRLHK